jgi:hypothetical protein
MKVFTNYSTVTQRKRARKQATYRAPIYHDVSRLLRVISLPGNRWGLQKLQSVDHLGQRDHDPWYTYRFFTNLKEAVAVLDSL